jgi:hypothetical protein
MAVVTVIVAVAAFAVGLTINMPVLMGVTPQLCALNPGAALKLDKIMRDGMRALKKRLSPVMALSTVFRDQVLTETDTIRVPYYSLETLTSKDFDGSYDFSNADGGNSSKSVTVNQRKYQPLEFTSKELARNSVLDLNKILMLKIEKLADDVLNDIFSIVTLANFGGPIFKGDASGFDRTDLSGIRTKLTTGYNWPSAGRSLILDSDYEGALVTDQLNVNTTGTDAALRNGAVGRLLNFDIFDHPNMPANSEHLVGCAILPYAILCAFAPIAPADEIPTIYRAYTDPESQLTLEYRAWGDPDSDSAKRTIEVNYGYAKGDGAQLKRFVDASSSESVV